ncbi:MAG: nucleotidyltransferase family protein, partial [Candidatus Omnitrophica bacterium]|nr:nucleotidyltransferase family protein [Candidatus Omnitrophota bacterium]
MKALILIGGQGTRLRPFTLNRCKCLLPLVNRPLITYQLALLKRFGFKEVVLAANASQPGLSEITRLGKEFSLSVKLSLEKSPLGTAGAIRNAAPFFKKEKAILVFNGDFVADFNLERIIALHQERNPVATIILAKVRNPSSYGLVV